MVEVGGAVKVDRTNAIIIIVLLALVIGVSAFLLRPPIAKAPDRSFCIKDEDCIPGICCHPSSCVNKFYEPNCEGIVCTQECRPGTMDCGAGKCMCRNGRCMVEWVK